MTNYQYFTGIDIGKFNFVISVHGQKETKEYENTSIGIKEFLKDHKDILKKSLCILETTGGYEMELLYTLCDKNIIVHRADTRKVKNFIRSYGNTAKTDQLDAKALAKYGAERYSQLCAFNPPSKEAMNLFALIRRRFDLKQMLVAEKNRLQAPSPLFIKESCQKIIQSLTEQMEMVMEEIKRIMDANPLLKQKQAILKNIPGIGEIISLELLILLPELGQLDRRKIASLVGLAPVANDSGKYKGYRGTGHGRGDIKPALFLAAMAARNSKSELKAFFEKLIQNGKHKMVALTALMRKLIVIANARLRDFMKQLPNSTLETQTGVL